MTAIRMKNNNDNVVVRNARLAVKTELEKKRMCNQVIAKFDLKTKKSVFGISRWYNDRCW